MCRIFSVWYHAICKQWHFFFSISIFISFSCLIAMARTSKTMLNKTGKRGHPCLVAQLRENAFSFSPIDYDISYVIIADIFTPERSQSSASQFFCPSSPFHRDDSKARTGTLSCWRCSRTAIGFRKRLGLCSVACLSLLFFFSHFSRCSQPFPPGSFPLSLQGSV